jgi:cell division FtsZ-interacting protein ZapD
MATLKEKLTTQGMKLMGDPRVMKLMQDERVMKAVMAAMSMPGKVQSFTRGQVQAFAKTMSIATETELKDLKKTVRKLEDELARLQRDVKEGKKTPSA